MTTQYRGPRGFKNNVTFDSKLRLKHQAPVPTGTDTGYGRLYVDDSDGYLHFIDAYGADTQITAGSDVLDAAGADRQVQFNDAGSFGASADLSLSASGLLQFGGITSSFPAIKRNTAGLEIRTGDDGWYAPLAASTFDGYGDLNIHNGNIRTLAATDWDLKDNDGYALSFDTPGHEHLLVLDTTDGSEQVRVGSTAMSEDFPLARMIVSESDTGVSANSVYHIGLGAEAAADASGGAYGVYSIGTTAAAAIGIGVFGKGTSGNPANTASAYGGQFAAASVHDGPNVGVSLYAGGSNVDLNQALQIIAGDIKTFAATDWDLKDNDPSALSFDSTNLSGILNIDTTTDVERITMSGDLQIDGYIKPEVDNVYTLGTPDLRWKDAYLGPQSLSISVKSTDYGYTADKTFRFFVDTADESLKLYENDSEVLNFSYVAPVYSVSSSQTANYNASFDEVVRADPSSGGFIITLPTPSAGTGKTVIVKNTTSSTNTLTIDSTGSELIDGQSAVTITTGFSAIMFVSYGSEWGRV